MLQAVTNRAKPKRRVGLRLPVPAVRVFVAAQVERADDERFAVEALGDLPVDLELIFFAGLGSAAQEQELGAEEADSGGALGHAGGDLFGEFNVAVELD